MTYIEVTPHWRYFNVSTNSRAWFISASGDGMSACCTAGPVVRWRGSYRPALLRPRTRGRTRNCPWHASVRRPDAAACERSPARGSEISGCVQRRSLHHSSRSMTGPDCPEPNFNFPVHNRSSKSRPIILSIPHSEPVETVQNRSTTRKTIRLV